MRKVISVLLVCSLLLVLLPSAVFAAESEATVENISIGGGGGLFTPMIDPTNPDRYYATCDMGGLYYSYDRGQSWNRSTDAIGWLRRACIADNGDVFAGGYGLYASTDHGKTLELIYPKNPLKQVSRCGWHENLMLAEDFDLGYLCGVTATADKVWFATSSWEGNFRLMYADHDGDNLHLIHTAQLTDPYPTDIEFFMDARGSCLYYIFDNTLWKYDAITDTITQLYAGQGTLVEVEWVGDQLFVLDDLADETKILYTSDFVTWQDLMDLNDLPAAYDRWDGTHYFEWHFTELAGNNFNSIFLHFLDGSNEGIMKFDGSSFAWVFDSIFMDRNTIIDDGWSYGSPGPFFGIATDPTDDDFCIVGNGETVFTLRYGGADDREVHSTHCVQTEDGVYSTTGLNVQTTYSVKEDPFDPDHIIICTTDLGLQNSYDNGKSFKRMELIGDHYIYNTCYDLYFDTKTEGLIYGLWSNRHDAPYAPSIYDTDWTQGRFAVSRDGGDTWDFTYSTGLPADCIPVKMSVEENGSQLTIAVATFNRGFFISYDSGRTFTSLNSGMQTVEGLIFGEDIVMTADHIYCLAAPYNCITGNWDPAMLYDYDRRTGALCTIDLGELSLVRSLTYDAEKGLFLNVIPTNHYAWYVEHDAGLWSNDNGGIYHYDGNTISCVFSCYNGIFHSAFAPDGTMYATEPYGKVYAGKDGEFTTFAEGLFTQLKNVSFSSDGDTMYITTFGGGTYRMAITPPEEPACTHSEAYRSLEDETHLMYCASCQMELGAEACVDGNKDNVCDCCGYCFPRQTTYSQKTSFTNGKSYLITISNRALEKDLRGTQIRMTGTKDAYQLANGGDDLTHWSYSSGKIYCEVNGRIYYLSVNSAKKLCTTTSYASAVNWTVSDNRISTAIKTSQNSRKTTTYYLGLSGSNFTVSTRKTSVVLYQVN